MDTFLFVIALAFCVWVGYKIGHTVGANLNLKEKLGVLLQQVPINVEIYMVDETYYAQVMIIGTFLGQNTDRAALIETVSDHFPDRSIVISQIT